MKLNTCVLIAACLMKTTLLAQTTNTWTQLNDFLGQGRTDAVAFVVNNKAYVGTGLNSAGQALNDFWVYNPTSDTWTQKQNAGGIGRWAAVGFGIGSKGYLGTGYIGQSGSGTAVNDFYEYNPSTDIWTIKQNVGLTGRAHAVAFSSTTKGFVVTGVVSDTQYTDNILWEYSPTSNTWTQRPGFPGSQRERAGSFTIWVHPMFLGV